MAIDIDKILEQMRRVDIEGISHIERIMVGEEEQQAVIELRFLRLKGALKNDPELNFRMIVGADNPEDRPNDLRFVVTKVDECQAFSKDMAIYMDANWNTNFGAHKWDPGDGEVRFSYVLLLSDAAPDHPDTALLQRILRDMYEGLLFHDKKTMMWGIAEDPMLSDEEKKAKAARLQDAVNALLEPASGEDDGAV